MKFTSSAWSHVANYLKYGIEFAYKIVHHSKLMCNFASTNLLPTKN